MGCYGVRGLDGGNNEANWIFCASSPSLVQNPNYASIGRNYVWVVDGTSPVFDQWWGIKPGAVIVSLPTQADVDSWLGGRGVGGSCSGCLSTPPPPVDKYDCINAACIKSTVYNTPGFFASLAECQTQCGAGCSGQCISNAEWSQIESLAAQLKNKDCS